MINIKKVKFSDLFLIPSKNGLTRPTSVRGQGYRMVNMGELFAHSFIGDISMERVQMNERELGVYTLEPGDLLFARQSLVLAGAGQCSYVEEQSEPTTFESHLIRIRLNPEIADSKFYYYLFKTPYSGISTIVRQCAQSGIRASDLSNLGVFYLNLPIQKRIVQLISKYDDLIKNNTRRVQLLEDSARHLYEEWFIRLRFPGYEHTTIEDGIPEGWSKKILKEVITLKYGKGLKEDNRIFGSIPVYGSSGIVGFHNEPMVKGPGIILGRKGNVGSVFRSNIDFWPIDTVYYITSDESSNYLFQNLKGQVFQNSDGAVPGLNRDRAYCKKILIPTPFIFKEFERITTPIYSQIDQLNEINSKLRSARDLLLPRLICGDIPV